MQASTQPASFRSALASVFSNVFQSPRSLDSSTPAESQAEAAADLSVVPDGEAKQEQDQPVASVPADPYAIRIADIKQKFDADAAAAVEQQQQLQQAAQQAKQRELEALAAADAAYTPAWRQAGLPAKASPFAADATWLAGAQLLNPAAIMHQQEASQQKEVLQPPAVFEYCDKEADPHYFTSTNNLKVRQMIASERIATVKSQKMQSQPCNKQQQKDEEQQQQQQMSTVTSRSTAKSQALSGAVTSSYTGFRAGRRSIPWSQLPQEQVSQKAAAAAARHKALAGIMTPEQRESEERIIKSMYHKLSFLRNPRYPMPPAAAAMLQNGLRGSSSLRMQQQKQQHSTTSRARSNSPGSKSSCRSKAGALVATAAAAAVHSCFVRSADVGFYVVPEAGVLFDAYEPGGVYFQTLQLQNVGDVIKGLRLLPPASRYFQVSLPRYPSAANELAPGMAAEVSVCFTPDTLGDYSDAFVVETVLGRFEVSLRGSRPHPHLTLGEELQAGDVLVGNSRSRTVDFVNTGGAGRFLVQSAADWAAAQATDGDTNAHIQQHQQGQLPLKQHSSSHGAVAGVAAALSPRVAHSSLPGSAPDKKAAAAAAVALEPAIAQAASGAAVSGAFAVTPTFLDLPPGASGRLTVNFSPDRPGQHAGDFVLICDNCTVRPLKLVGGGSDVDVQLVALDGRQLEEQVWFGQVNPGCSCFRKLKVQNSTQLPFPYKWRVDHLQLPGSAKTATLAGPQQSQQMLNAATAAVAAPGAAGVAAAASLSPTLNARATSAAAAAHTSISVQADHMNVSTLQPRAPATSTCSSSSEMHSGISQAQQQQHQAQVQESVQQQAVFSVHPSTGVLQPGEVAEFTVGFTPSCVAEHAASAVLLVERSGDALMTAMKAAGVRSGRSSIANRSSSSNPAAGAAAASWSGAESEYESRPHPATSSAAAAAGAAAAGIESSWESVVALGLEGLATPVCLEVEPSAVVHLPGQLTVGDAGQQVLLLRNKSAAAAHFSFGLPSSGVGTSTSTRDVFTANSKEFQAQGAVNAAVSVEPASGFVPSYGSLEITVKFTGLKAGIQAERLLCRVAHGATIAVVAKASVVEPVVTAAVPLLDFGVICIGSSHTQQLKLQNTAVSCSTDWQLMQLDHEPCCAPMQLQLLPRSGTLGPAAEGTAAVTVTGSCKGSYKMLLQLTSRSSSGRGGSSSSSRGGGSSSSSGGGGSGSISSNGDGSSCPHQQRCFVQVIVTVSEPCLVLDTYKIRLKPTYLGVQQQRSITITNTSHLPLQFSWTVQQLQWQQQQQWRLGGSSSSPGSKRTSSSNSSGGAKSHAGSRQGGFSSEGDSCSLSTSSDNLVPVQPSYGQLCLRVSPAMGHLDPQQSKQVQLLLEPTHVGPVKLLCCCVVPNMSQLAGFVLTAFIEGLRVAYEIEQPLSQDWLSGTAAAAAAAIDQGACDDTQLVVSDGNRGFAATAAAGGAASGAAAAAPLLADFGVVAVHQVSELRLRVTNLTSIDTTMRLWVSRYPAAAAATAATGPPDTQHLRKQQQQLGASASGVHPKAGSQLGLRSQSGQPGTSQSGQPGSSSGHAHGLPVSTLPASPAPAQQQHQATAALGQSHSRGSTCSPQQRWRTFSPQQRQQQQQPSIAARLAAAVSGNSPTGPLNLQATTNMSITVTNPGHTNSSSCGVTQLAGAKDMPGPFRSAAGNSMIATRKVAAAAAKALGEGCRGCAVCIQPHSCNLAGWSTADLQLVAYNNLPGTYVDYISVQVGDLPVRRIPLRLSVVGSPLVLSEERVLLQGLQTLLAVQHSAAGLGTAAAVAMATTAAVVAAGSSGTSLHVAGASTGSTVKSGDIAAYSSSSSGGRSSSSSSIPDNVAGVTTVQLPLGVVPVGVMHQRTFYVINTGALPMHLSWQCSVPAQLAAPAAAAAAAAAANDKQLPVAAAAAGGSSGERISFLPVDGATETDAAVGLAAGSGSSAGMHDASAVAAAAASSKAGSDPAAAAGLGAKGRSKAGSSVTGGRASTTGATAAAAAAAAAKGNSGTGAAKATSLSGDVKRGSGTGVISKHQSAGDNQAATGAAADAVAAEVQQHQQQQDQQQQQQGDDLASRRTTSTSDAGQHSSTSDDAAAAALAADSEPAVPEYEQLLPSGGPSGLLKTLQAMAQHRKQQQQQQQQQQGVSDAAAVTAAYGASESDNSPLAVVVDSSHVLEAFSVEPQQCVVPVGQQQKCTVTFSSWHSGVHSVNLIGKQVFAAADSFSDDEQTPTANAKDKAPEMTVTLWPRQQDTDNTAADAANGSTAGALAAAAAAAAPVELILTGGFHAHAAPPLTPIPNLQVALSATAVKAQLTPSDPSCLAWSCCSTHDPSSHGSYKHTVTLCNTAGCPLIFQLDTTGPFSLVSAVPSVTQDVNAFRGLKGTSNLSSMLSSSSSSTSNQSLPKDAMLLPPGESVNATLLFTPPPAAAAAPAADTPVTQQQQQQQQSVQQQQHCDTEYTGQLVVKPTNGQQQSLPLSAILMHPGLTASPARLDFGLVHTLAPRPLQLLLTNPTRVDASWQVQVLLLSTAAGSSSSVFCITPDHGVIPGRGLGMPNTQRVTVTYTPVGNLAAAAHLRLVVDSGSGCSVKLQGQGTFEETCEHLAVLKDM